MSIVPVGFGSSIIQRTFVVVVQNDGLEWFASGMLRSECHVVRAMDVLDLQAFTKSSALRILLTHGSKKLGWLKPRISRPRLLLCLDTGRSKGSRSTSCMTTQSVLSLHTAWSLHRVDPKTPPMEGPSPCPP